MAADRRLFFLLLRAMGVYCLVEGIHEWVESLQGDLVDGILYAEWLEIWCMRMPNYCSAVVMLGLGGYLLFGGVGLLNRVAPAREGRCWDCDYDLTGNVSGRCSECGRSIGQAVPQSNSIAETDPPWFHGALWARRIIVTLVIVFLSSVLISALLRRFDLIICEPNSGRLCFAGQVHEL